MARSSFCHIDGIMRQTVQVLIKLATFWIFSIYSKLNLISWFHFKSRNLTPDHCLPHPLQSRLPMFYPIVLLLCCHIVASSYFCIVSCAASATRYCLSLDSMHWGCICNEQQLFRIRSHLGSDDHIPENILFYPTVNLRLKLHRSLQSLRLSIRCILHEGTCCCLPVHLRLSRNKCILSRNVTNVSSSKMVEACWFPPSLFEEQPRLTYYFAESDRYQQ